MYTSASPVNTPIGFSAAGDQANGTMPITNSLGIKQGDLLLTALPSGGVCRIWQATGTMPAPTAPALVGTLSIAPFEVKNSGLSGGPSWNGIGGPSLGLDAYTGLTEALNLGSSPNISAFGVDVVNANLMTMDLLRGGAPVAVAENVINIQALYGVDAGMLATKTPNNNIDWQTPTGVYAASLLNPNATATNPPLQTINAIRAVRVAIVTRSTEPDKEQVSPANITMFSDLAPALQASIGLNADQRHYRYKIYDTVIPIRNMLLQ